jgi:hypothetical protein
MMVIGFGWRNKTVPTDIALSNTMVTEDASVGTVIGTVSSNGSQPVTFTILEPPSSIQLFVLEAAEDTPVDTVLTTIQSDDPYATFELI